MSGETERQRERERTIPLRRFFCTDCPISFVISVRIENVLFFVLYVIVFSHAIQQYAILFRRNDTKIGP